jgi:uncharacterized UPF0146 family protein
MTLQKIKKNLNKAGYFKLMAFFATKTFRFFEKYFGVHFTPANYYSPVPVHADMKPAVFEKIFSCKGIDWNLDKQLEFLKQIYPKYFLEYAPKPNSGLSLVDAFILFAMIREQKPKKMVEVGAGDTTYIALQALELNRKEGFDFQFITVEPYPRADIAVFAKPGFQLIQKKLQELELAFFSDIDLLFIDSSHVCKVDSDVNYEMLEILPQMKVGALIHWHDIPMPQNYWKDWMDTGTMFWNESYLLHAFLLFNDSFKIQWGSNYMKLNHYNEMAALFPYLIPEHRLSSFWLQRSK